MANITNSEGSGLQDSFFVKSLVPIKRRLEKIGDAYDQTSLSPELVILCSSFHWGD